MPFDESRLKQPISATTYMYMCMYMYMYVHVCSMDYARLPSIGVRVHR